MFPSKFYPSTYFTAKLFVVASQGAVTKGAFGLVTQVDINLTVPAIEGVTAYYWYKDDDTIPFATSDTPTTTDTLPQGVTSRTYRINTLNSNGVLSLFSTPYVFNYTPSAPEADMCTTYIQLEMFQGTSIVGYIKIAGLPQSLNGSYLVGTQYSATVDAGGRITFPALPQQAIVQVMVPDLKINSRITLPNTTLYQIA